MGLAGLHRENLMFGKAIWIPASLVGAALVAIGVSWAAPTTFTVNSNADTADLATDGVCDTDPSPTVTTCTLRAAITEANATPDADTINITATGTITLTSDLPAITKPVTINGPSARITIDGNNANSIFRFTDPGTPPVVPVTVGAQGTYSLTNLIVTNGMAEANSGSGGILFNPANGSTLNLNNVDITSNAPAPTSTSGNGGGLAVIGSSQTVNYTDGTIDGNTTPSGATVKGGGIYNEGFIKLDSVTISNNFAGLVTGTTNTANGVGGGIYLAAAATVDLRNVTIANNQAGVGGGIAADSSNSSSSKMRNTTIAFNKAYTSGSAGGLDLAGKQDNIFPGSVGAPFTSNIIAANTLTTGTGMSATTSTDNCANGFAHQFSDTNNSGYNLADDTTCNFVLATDHVGPAGLFSLADNGGGIKTVRISASSPAIDAGNPQFSFSTDERGSVVINAQTGAVDQSGSLALRDIGAYEFGGFGILQFSAASYTVKENAGSKTITVNRTGDTSRAQSAPVKTTSASNTDATPTVPAATAGAGGDYTTTTGTLTWAAGEGGAKTFNVPILDDTVADGNKNVDLTIDLASAAVADTYADYGVNAPTVHMTITDFEEGIVQFKAAAGSTTSTGGPAPLPLTFALGYRELEADASGQKVTLTRSGGSDGAVSVTVNTGSGSATAGADYTAGPYVVSWADGVAGDQTVNISLINDSVYEDPSPNATVGNADNCDSDDETVPLTLSGATGGLRIATADTSTASGPFVAATLNIQDDDAAKTGVLSMSAATYSVNEGGAINLVVKRTGGSDCAISVQITTADGSAVAGSDYTAPSNNPTTLTWAHGETADKTLSVTTTNDTTPEADETLTASLSNAAPTQAALNAKVPPPPAGSTAPALGDIASSTATIVSDEKLQFQFSASSYTANEGTPASVVVKLRPTTPTAQTITDDVVFDVATSDGTATSADYTPLSPNPKRITFKAGGTGEGFDQNTLSIPITANDGLEFDEQFNVSLTSPDGEGQVNGASTVPVVIKGAQVFAFSATEYHTTAEGGVLTVSVKRLNGTAGTVSVDYTVAPGTATSGTDYSVVGGASGTFTWTAGDAGDKTFDINILGDRIVEQPDETILLSLSNPTGNALVSTTAGTATAFITDDDTGIVFGPAPSSTEGSPMTVTVKRVGVSAGAISANYATSDGTAVAGTDYTATSGTLNWASGDVADKTFSVPTTNNTKNNFNKTINLTLSNPSANADVGPPTTGTITDDDSVTVAFSAATQTVSESVGMVTVTAVRTGTTDFDISVPFTVSGTANAADHAATDGVITIPASATSGSYTFLVSDDATDEPNETVVLTMGTPTGGSVSAASPSVHTVTITDNDAVTVAFSAATQTVAESAGTVTVTATRTGATSFDISVPYTVSGTATNPADHNAAAGTLTIPAGVSSASFTFTVADDAVDEPNETVVVTMGAPSGGDVSAAAPAAQTITITDNDAVTVSFTAASQTVSEKAGSVSVTVRRSGATTFSVSVPYTVSGSATNPADHNAASGSVTIPASASTANITFVVANDTVHESSETAIFTLGTPSGGDVTATSPTTHTVTINDDDAVQITAGENSPGVVVTPSGNVAAAGGGGSFSWSALLGLVGLGALRRRGARRFAPLLALLALVPGLAQAATPLAAPAPAKSAAPAPAGAFSYSGIDARYLTVHVKDPGTSASGTALGYTHTVGDKIFMGVGYSSISTGDFTVQGQTGNSKTTSLSVTLGAHRPITPTLDFSGAVDYMYGEAKAGGAFVGGNTEKGWGLEGGVRGRYSPQIEWGVALNYVSIFGSSDTSLSARGLYQFGASPFALAAGLGLGSQSTSFNLGLRYEL